MCGELGHDEFCEMTKVATDLDEHEPRKAFPPDADPTLQGWSIHVPQVPVPREMRDTTGPKSAARMAELFEVESSPDSPFTTVGLTDDAEARKSAPVDDVINGYFPNTVIELARYAKYGNDKHNPGEELHWAYTKSTDHGNCLMRHQMQADEIDPSSGYYHAVAVAIRALMQCETILLKNHPELRAGRKVKGFVR